MRGQAALEFMSTYGLAITAVLAMIAVLAFIAGDEIFYMPNQCNIEQPFACIEYKATTGGEILLGLVNVGAEITYVNLTIECNENPSESRSYEQFAPILTQFKLNTSLIRLSCPISSKLFKANVVIFYQYRDESVIHEAYGTLKMETEN